MERKLKLYNQRNFIAKRNEEHLRMKWNSFCENIVFPINRRKYALQLLFSEWHKTKYQTGSNLKMGTF